MSSLPTLGGTVITGPGFKPELWRDNSPRYTAKRISPGMIAAGIDPSLLRPGAIVQFVVRDGRVRDMRPLGA
jgi:hypothetical protein